MKGWIKMHRDFREHWVWQTPERVHRFTDLLMEVSFADSKPDPLTGEVKFRRGECRRSLRWWAKRWKIDHNEVSRFFRMLEGFDIVKVEKLSNDSTVIKLSEEYLCCLMDDDLSAISTERGKRQVDAPVTETQEEKLTRAQARAKFEEFRRLYPGSKRGGDKEFNNLARKYPGDYLQIVPLLMPALQALIKHRKTLKSSGRFCPEWPMLHTWINQSRWMMEFEQPEYDSFRDGPNLPKIPKVVR